MVSLPTSLCSTQHNKVASLQFLFPHGHEISLAQCSCSRSVSGQPIFSDMAATWQFDSTQLSQATLYGKHLMVTARETLSGKGNVGRGIHQSLSSTYEEAYENL